MIQDSIEHWLGLAAEQDEMAKHEAAMGHSTKPHAARAETYRRVAQALGLEAETGRPHCTCCLKEMGDPGAMWKRAGRRTTRGEES